MDLYEQAATELLRAIRGTRSQIAFARRLGYCANPITDWENGRRFPTVKETLRAALAAKLPVEVAFRGFAAIPPPDPQSTQSLAEWLRQLRGSQSIVEIAQRAERTRYAVSRWLGGRTEPRLPDFLRLLDALTARIHDFIHRLVDVNNVPCLYGRYAQVEAARRLAFERPWSEAVLRLLETQAYRAQSARSEQFVAQRLGIEEGEVVSLLGELARAGIIEQCGEKVRVIDNLTVDTSSTSGELVRVRQHWARVGLGRLEEQRTEDWFAYNVIAVSRADSERIEQRLRAAYREVRSIVAESEPTDVAAVLTMQLLRF